MYLFDLLAATFFNCERSITPNIDDENLTQDQLARIKALTEAMQDLAPEFVLFAGPSMVAVLAARTST